MENLKKIIKDNREANKWSPKFVTTETIRAIDFFFQQFEKGISPHDIMTQLSGHYGSVIADNVLLTLKRHF